MDHTNSVHLKQKRFKCSDCDLKSYYSQKIRKHKSNEHSDNDWKIERITCGDCFFNKGDHQCQENYIEEKIYNCNQCDYTTYQKGYLGRHKKIHAGEKPYKCNQCNYASHHKWGLDSHVKTHNQKIFKCKNCSFSCQWLHNLFLHNKREHKKISTNFALELDGKVSNCTHCDFKGKAYHHLKRHIEAVHLNLKRFACNSCDYKSYDEKNVIIHIRSHHKDTKSAKSQKLDCSDCMSNIDHSKSDAEHTKVTKKTLFVCKVCKYETKNRAFLKNHRRLVHGDKSVASKVLKCADCEFEAAKLKRLENHINSEHLNEKRFSCNSCDFQSFYANRVKSHILLKHKGSANAQMKTLECSDCQMDIKHSKCSPLWKIAKERDISKKKARACKQCTFVTLKSAYLKMHAELSHGQNSDPTKIINCTTCEFQTSKSSKMMDHANSVHLKQRRFKCSDCDLKSYYIQKIRKHTIREHSDNDCEVERLTCGDCISNREDHNCQEDDPETKNFECNFCDLRLPTTTHRVVVNHMKTSHPNQKLFHCNRCSFKCNWLYNLRSHKKLEHKIEAKKSDNLLATFSGIIGLFMKHTETQDSL